MSNNNTIPLQRSVGASAESNINEERKRIENVRLGLISIKKICSDLNITNSYNHFDDAILDISKILDNIDLDNQSGGKKKSSSKKPKTVLKKKSPSKKPKTALKKKSPSKKRVVKK